MLNVIRPRSAAEQRRASPHRAGHRDEGAPWLGGGEDIRTDIRQRSASRSAASRGSAAAGLYPYKVGGKRF